MKRSIRKIWLVNKCSYWSLIIVFGLFSSCKKDVLESKELIVYVQGEFGSPNNIVTAFLTHTPLAIWGNTTFNIPVVATREVPADVNVFVEPAEQLVSEFNKVNGKKSILLPANTYKLNSTQHAIKSGTFISQTLQVEITNAAALTDTNGYVLPVSITKIESEDKGVRVSNNRSAAYLYVPYFYTNIDSTEKPLTDAAMSRTGWSVTVSNTTAGALGPAMIDGNNATAWRSSNTATAGKWAILNMGSLKTIKGFTFVPNYVATVENPTQITVSTSTDNVIWTVQGIWKGTGPAATSTAASPDIKGINFISPVSAQYFRFDITAWVSGSRVGIAELNAIQ